MTQRNIQSILLGLVLIPTLLGGAGARGASAPPAAPPAPIGTQQSQAGNEPANSMCPVMTDEAIDPAVFAEYEGRKVYFCCRRCLRQFERDPQAYVVNLAAFSQPDDHAHDAGEPHAHGAAQESATREDQHAHEQGDEHEHEAQSDHAHANEESPAHDHERDHGSELPAFFQWLGKFHPAATDLPIGLLIAAALAEIMLIVTRRSWFAAAARFCVWIGAIGAVVAGALGWLFGGFHLTDSDWILTTHRWLGTSTTAIALIVLWLSEAHHRSPEVKSRAQRYRVSLFLGAALVSVTGFFGGAMLYGIDHYAW